MVQNGDNNFATVNFEMDSIGNGAFVTQGVGTTANDVTLTFLAGSQGNYTDISQNTSGNTLTMNVTSSSGGYISIQQ